MSVYFAEKDGLIKIGWSRSVAGRIRNLGAKLLGAIPGDRSVERATHERFSHLRVRPRGEWFKPADDLITYIRDNAQEHNPDDEMVQTGVRLSEALVERLDKAAATMSRKIGVRVTRTQILRLATEKGVESLEAEYRR